MAINEAINEAISDAYRELAAACRACDDVLARLPAKPLRSEHDAATAEAAKLAARAARAGFLRDHADDVYRTLTHGHTQPLRVEQLVYAAADRFPGLVPSRDAVDQERQLLQRDKEGVEIDQGIFVCHMLSSRTAGLHLVHTMLRPTREAEQRLARFCADGVADLGPVIVERVGAAGHVTLRNPGFLNAEDDSTVAPLETAIDLVLLDPAIEVGVLRGDVVSHRKYAGRRVFNAGINLTHLYHGKISFVGFFLARDLGFVNKLYRGLTGERFAPDEPEHTVEKPWIAAVDAFAIGGGCQILLTMDHVLAEHDAYFNLPARKEGIIPGAANLRLPRAVGARLARQAILSERGFLAASPEGGLLCDEVVPRDGMDGAIARAIAQLTSAGIVSAAANRRALRVAEEPLDVFRRYMALYARDQAECQFSPALIENLERNWDARRRVP